MPELFLSHRRTRASIHLPFVSAASSNQALKFQHCRRLNSASLLVDLGIFMSVGSEGHWFCFSPSVDTECSRYVRRGLSKTGLCWFLPVSASLCWFLLVSSGLCWSLLVCCWDGCNNARVYQDLARGLGSLLGKNFYMKWLLMAFVESWWNDHK